MIGEGKGFCALCPRCFFRNGELTELGRLWLSGLGCLLSGVRQQELGTTQSFLHPCSGQCRALKGFARNCENIFSLCLSRDLCPHHSLPSLMFRSTFPHSFIHSFLPSSSFSLPPSLPLPSFPPFPLPFSSIIYLINILLTFFPCL